MAANKKGEVYKMIKIVDIYKEKDKDKKLQMLEQRKRELLQRENKKENNISYKGISKNAVEELYGSKNRR